MNANTLFLLLVVLAIFDASPEVFRKRWKRQKPVITALQIGLNDEADFMNLTTFSLQVFKEQIIAPIRGILEFPKYQIIEWLYKDNEEEVFFHGPSNGNRPNLSIEDRMMRCLMFLKNSNAKLLEIMFGQKKSTIYEDAWLLIRVICKRWADSFKLPIKGSIQYLERVGAGILGDAFPTAVYIMDGHKVIF